MFLSPLTDQSLLFLSQEVERGSRVEEEVMADFIQQLESRISTEVPKNNQICDDTDTNKPKVCVHKISSKHPGSGSVWIL